METLNYIAGRWQASQDGREFEVRNPADDSLIAKVIVWGEDREVAIARGRRALSELELEGVPTTRELALDIVSSEEFGSGDYTTSFLADAAPSLESLRGGAA